MNAPDTIYIDENNRSLGCSSVRIKDTDIPYVRADICYELAKTVEELKAEIAALNETLAECDKHIDEIGAASKRYMSRINEPEVQA